MNVMELVYAQPHEGVTGIERAGDPLLTESGALLATELMGMLYRAVLVGNPAPKVREMYERINAPAPGDAVVVFDAIYFKNADHKFKGTGYLVAVRAEWATTDEEWAAARDEDESLTDADRFVEREAWYVQYGPEPVDICRWSNCKVLAIPRV
jgi:hypothetical protein